MTVHQNDGSYLAHTQGRKHQTNLARRHAREEKEAKNRDGVQPGLLAGVAVKKNVIKIGVPGYRATKIRDPLTRQNGLLIQLQYPNITQGVTPKIRFMSAFEQKVEEPPDKNFQYLVIAAEPYETVAFKIQSRDIDKAHDKYFTWFDEDSKDFWVQILFKTEREERYAGVPGLAPGRR